MPAALEIALTFLVAAGATAAATPLAVRLARRTGLLDHPVAYKQHGVPTPYLGGLAIACGALAAAVLVSAISGYVMVLMCAFALGVVGTIDDRWSLSPLPRVVSEIAVGVALWQTGHGFRLGGSGLVDGALTVLWIVGVVNAVNLMDNTDGAAASVVATSTAGAAALALGAGAGGLALLCVAVTGACVGFLRENLASPSRIFMGDGGSMFLGTLAAALGLAAASAGRTFAGAEVFVAAGLLVGLPVFDVALVVVSRRRGRRPILSGGRDHLAHRLTRSLGAPWRAAIVLAAIQGFLVASVFLSASERPVLVIALGVGVLAAAVTTIAVLETRPRGLAAISRWRAVPHPAPSPGDG